MFVDENGTVHPRTCFTAGTLVHTKDGTKVIEDIKVGDVVLSWNEDSGEKEYKTVTELFLHEVELLYELSFQRPNEDSLVSLVDEAKIKTTWNHPFWVVDKQAWIEARHLKAGDKVLLSSGKEVAISGTRSYNVEATKVYNFEVADNHTYFVGEDGVLVHNYEVSRLRKDNGYIVSESNYNGITGFLRSKFNRLFLGKVGVDLEDADRATILLIQKVHPDSISVNGSLNVKVLKRSNLIKKLDTLHYGVVLPSLKLGFTVLDHNKLDNNSFNKEEK
jgi:dipeptidyl aminopeptidase/acylaminoacyl peptidase